MSELGGKGKSLSELSELGFPVPSFAVVRATDIFLSDGLIEIKGDSRRSLESFLEKSTSDYFAVRSSCSAEDGKNHSFAGLFDSYLNVPRSELNERIRDVVSSIHSERVRKYRESNNIDSVLTMSVVIQEMVFGEWSGVAFSRHPISSNGHIYLESCPGLGHNVVDGKFTPVQVSVDRFGKVLKIAGPDLIEGQVFNNGTLQGIKLEKEKWPSKAGQAVLDCLLRLEAELGYPVDIEWTFFDGEFYLLQCRPITTEYSKLSVYTDFNIIESYPGTLSQLSYEFVRKSYERVFNEAIELFGFSDSRRNSVKSVTPDLVELHQGHIYYNLNNYYYVLDNLPGSGHRVSWHKMIGGGVLPWVEVNKVIPWTFLEYIKLFLNLSYRFPQWFFIVKSFSKKSNKAIQLMNEESKRLSSYPELMKCAEKYSRLTRSWGWTVLNDLLIMVFTKRVETLNIKSNLDISIQEFLKTDSNLESIRPLQALQRLKSSIGDVEELLSNHSDVFKSYERVQAFLKQENPRWAADLDSFMDEFGDRCFEELKLESLSFRQNPRLLLEILKSYEVNVKPKGEIKPNSTRKFPSWISLKLLRKSVKFREELRLQRGLAFGWLRNTLYSAYKSFLKEYGVVEFTFKDFLNLSFEEHRRFIKGEIFLEEFFNKGKSRSQVRDADYPSQFYLSESEGLIDWQNRCDKSTKETKDLLAHMSGLGASKGVVRGVALVVESPTEVFNAVNLQEKILVTRTTDPAWVYLMSQCCGLVSEKGSLLSHTAIIGRELEIPTVVSAEGVLQNIASGDLIEIDGSSGRIDFVERDKFDGSLGSKEL